MGTEELVATIVAGILGGVGIASRSWLKRRAATRDQRREAREERRQQRRERREERREERKEKREG